MATESILRPGELKEILLREIASADLTTEDVSEVGTVLEVRDGVARIYGLKSAIASYEQYVKLGGPYETQARTAIHNLQWQK